MVEWGGYPLVGASRVCYRTAHQHEACMLAHTLNVADLTAPVMDFDRDP